MRTNEVTDEERELGGALTRCLSAATRLSEYPKSRIDVIAFVLEDDGSAFAGCVTAAGLAMADAGIEMYDLVGGCNAGVFEGKVVLDPDRGEEDRGEGGVMVGWMGGRVVDLVQTGEIDVGLLGEAVKLCCGGGREVVQLMRGGLEKAGRKKRKGSH